MYFVSKYTFRTQESSTPRKNSLAISLALNFQVLSTRFSPKSIPLFFRPEIVILLQGVSNNLKIHIVMLSNM